MRYWIAGEDEDLEHDRALRIRLGQRPSSQNGDIVSAALPGAIQLIGLAIAAAFMMLDH